MQNAHNEAHRQTNEQTTKNIHGGPNLILEEEEDMPRKYIYTKN